MITFASSAPLKPGVSFAMSSSEASGGQRPRAAVQLEDLEPAVHVRHVDRDLAVEAARPQQRRVEDVGAVRAPITTIPLSASKPSISTSSWFRVCSRSSLPCPTPAPRRRPAASSSSMKTIAGAILRARSNRSRTRAAPTPTSDSTNSEPESEKNDAAASPATARASSVLPVPGGPTSSTPGAPSRPGSRNGSGRPGSRGSRAARRPTRPTPATSAKVTGCEPFLRFLPRLPSFEKAAKPPAPPSWPIRMKNANRQTRIRIGIRNWTTIRRVGFHDCWSTSTIAPPRRKRAQQVVGLRVRGRVGGPQGLAVLGVDHHARVLRRAAWRVSICSSCASSTIVLSGDLAPGRLRPGRAQQGEEQDREHDRGDQQERAERVAQQQLQHLACRPRGPLGDHGRRALVLERSSAPEVVWSRAGPERAGFRWARSTRSSSPGRVRRPGGPPDGRWASTPAQAWQSRQGVEAPLGGQRRIVMWRRLVGDPIPARRWVQLYAGRKRGGQYPSQESHTRFTSRKQVLIHGFAAAFTEISPVNAVTARRNGSGARSDPGAACDFGCSAGARE